MTKALDRLLELLDLEQIEVNIFRGRSPDERRQRVFGGQVADPLLHVCLMTYASDMTLLDSVLLGHGLSWIGGRTSGASLDHAMWFHRPFRADRWLLYAQDSPVARGARGLAHGEVFTADGQLVVSVMQEGLIRAAPRPASPPGV